MANKKFKIRSKNDSVQNIDFPVTTKTYASETWFSFEY